MEGGGETSYQKATIRTGFDEFLDEYKQKARSKHLRWSLIACGSRDDAFRNFRFALKSHPNAFNILLVDSEGPVDGSNPREYLRKRDPSWELPKGVEEDHYHLMVQMIESWIVCDPQTLHEYYGQGFQKNSLPKTKNIETVEKRQIEQSLEEATKKPRKESTERFSTAPNY